MTEAKNEMYSTSRIENDGFVEKRKNDDKLFTIRTILQNAQHNFFGFFLPNHFRPHASDCVHNFKLYIYLQNNKFQEKKKERENALCHIMFALRFHSSSIFIYFTNF